MRSITEFILEASLEKGIEELLYLTKNTLLTKEVTEEDFEETSKNIFTLSDADLNKDMLDAFWKGRSSIFDMAIHTSETDKVKEIALVQSGKEDILVRANLEADTIEMSGEIKNKLIGK